MRINSVRDLLNPTEYYECLDLVEYLDILKNQGKVKLFTHIPNETFTKSWNVKRKNKLMGVRKGFPDYVVITDKEIVFIEMKRKKGGVTSPEQKEWIEAFRSLGLRAEVCKGFEEAKLFLDQKR